MIHEGTYSKHPRFIELFVFTCILLHLDDKIFKHSNNLVIKKKLITLDPAADVYTHVVSSKEVKTNMLVGNKHRYTKIAFNNEAEIESAVYANNELLFGPYAVFLPKTKITTLGGKGTIPDGIVIDLGTKAWYLVEIERGSHGTWEHIAPQVSKQITAILKAKNLEHILSLTLDQLKKDDGLKGTIIEELHINEISIHGTISEILKKLPIVAIPIDDIPSDLTEWARTLKHEVKIWKIEKFSREDGNDILYSFPDEQVPDVVIADGGVKIPETKQSGGQALQKLIKSGLLSVGETLTLEYGPKGKKKQKFFAVVTKDGLELDGKIYSPSYAAVACMKKTGSNRQTANGWTMWRNGEGLLINDLFQKLPPN